MTPAEAQIHLTRRHACGCLELWFLTPTPGALRCATHADGGGPIDTAAAPARRDEALAVLAAADVAETARRCAARRTME